MTKDFTRQAFWAGLILLSICTIGVMLNLGSLVVIVTHFFPGLVLGLLVTESVIHPLPVSKKIVFVFTSTAIYIAGVFFIDIDDEERIGTSVKLLTASSVGAVLLALAYDLILEKRISILHSFALPFIYGIAASTLSAFCIYYLQVVRVDKSLEEGILWLGIFSIFPMWYYFFALNIQQKTPAVEKVLL